jgi:hypothetical protein
MATTLTSTGITFPDSTTQTTAASGGGSSIGVDQTWQDVTGSRSLNTTYTNDTGKPIQVTASIQAQSTLSTKRAIAVVNGVTILESYTQDCCGIPQYSWFPLSFIVPAGNTYQLRGMSISRWAELR